MREGRKQLTLLLGADANTRIGHANAQGQGGIRLGIDGYVDGHRTPLGEFDAVANQV